jgi:flavin reductase (DIM6/NTAB) family NADH-FMN oxidoreductase RutF
MSRKLQGMLAIVTLLLLLHHPIVLALGSSFTETLKPPLLDSPVFSLATVSPDGTLSTASPSTTNMNILTYATPVSMSPDRLWVIGLYKGTVTYDNFVASRRGTLQLLRPEHATLIPVLGGKSGRDTDKYNACKSLGFSWVASEMQSANNEEPWRLPSCSCYLQLECVELCEAGSHDVAICKVVGMQTDNSSNDDEDSGTRGTHLGTQALRSMGIITEQGRVAEQ